MAVVNSTPTRPAKRASTTSRTPRPAAPSPKARVQAHEPIPAYGLGDGVLTFRHGLRARERGVLDRAIEIVSRCLRQPGYVLASPDAVKQYIYLQLAGEKSERFAVMFFDFQNRIIAFEILFTGTTNQTSVYPREVALAALAHGAASAVIAHNHPSGSVQPSPADEGLTQTLKAALALVDVRLLDHIIVGRTGALSMAERGLM